MDLRKLEAHGLAFKREGRRYLYRLTDKGLKSSFDVCPFPQARLRPGWPTACLNRKPNPTLSVNSKLETAYRKADHSIQKIVDLLAASIC